MSIILPDLGINNNNNSILLAIEYGCQFHCMNIQNFDNYMKFNTSYFDDENSAFVLKPPELRHESVKVSDQTAETIKIDVGVQNPVQSLETGEVGARLMAEVGIQNQMN